MVGKSPNEMEHFKWMMGLEDEEEKDEEAEEGRRCLIKSRDPHVGGGESIAQGYGPAPSVAAPCFTLPSGCTAYEAPKALREVERPLNVAQGVGPGETLR